MALLPSSPQLHCSFTAERHQHHKSVSRSCSRSQSPHSKPPHAPCATTSAAATNSAALEQQQVALQLTQPPRDWNYKEEILPETMEVVQQQHPELLDLVEAGNLVVYQRPSTYQERRSDGYEEPQLIFILGTAHVSQQSADDVTRLIAAVQPDAVVVELCKSRTGVLHVQDNIQQQEVSLQQQQQQEWQQRWQQQWQDWQQRRSQQQGGGIPAASSSASSSLEEDAPSTSSPSNTSSTMLTSTTSSSQNTSSDNGMWSQWQSFLRRSQSAKASNPLSLSGPDPLSAMARSASLGGQQAMLLRLLIAGQARKAADQLGVQPGAEFRAAAEAAAAVPGAQCCLVLGDRPIEITLSRAWEALSWQRRLQLLGDLLVAGTASSNQAVLSQEQVEALRSDDAISGLFHALSELYPELVAPLITERDLYLSWSLKRSKAVNGARAVVGCVGKGHLRGIVYALKHDQGNLRFKDLVGGKNNRQNRKAAAAAAVRRLLLEVVLGAAAYAAWVAFTSSYAAGQ